MSRDTFIQKLAAHILSHYDLGKQELTVVFPNKRAAFFLRNEIKGKSQQTLWLPQMISIEEAVTQWSGITLADNIDMLFELIDINAQLHKDPNSDLSVFGSQAAQMAKDFDEIDQYGIDATKVFEYVVGDKELQVWDIDSNDRTDREKEYLQFFKSLQTYYLQLRDRLARQGKGYYGMLTRNLSELSETELLEKVGDGKIIFAGFNAMSATEERIIDTLIRNGKAEILFDYDEYYVNDINNEAGHFARLYKAKHPGWFDKDFSNLLTSEEKTIHIINACGNALQAKALQAKLQETNDAKQAVVLADEHLLIPVLNAIPDNGVYTDFKVSMGYPIAKTPVNQLIKAYFTLCRRDKIKRNINHNGRLRDVEGWYIWPIFNLMDLEIVKIVFPRTENAAFNRWKTDAVNSGKFIFEANDLEELHEAPGIQTFLRILLTGLSEKVPKTVLANLNELLSFIARTLLAKEDNTSPLFLLNQVSETGKHICRLAQVVENNAKYVTDIKSVEILYRLLASSASIKLKSDNIEGLQIMGLLESRNLGFERLHLLSVNEGVLPPDKPQGSFIPQFIRRAYGLPSYTESQAVVAYNFYRLLQNGKDVYLYYNSLGETFGGEASRFILQIRHELAKNANIKIIEETFESKAESSLEVKALSARKAGAMDRLHYLIEEKGLSPSALSKYLHCPFQYYLHYIAQLQDDSVEEDVGVNDIGTVIHDTLELLFADYKQQVIDKTLFDTAIRPLWQKKLAEAIAKKFRNGFPDVGFNYLNRVTIEQQLTNYLDYTSMQLEKDTLTILDTEGELRASLTTGKGDSVFFGRSDRIDRFDGLIRVIDYKTGQVHSADLKLPVYRQGDSKLEYLRQIPEKALQLLLYKYLYLRLNPSVKPDQVTGAIHGLKYAHDIEYGLSKSKPRKEDSNADTSFLDDTSFIADMETMLGAVVDEMLDTNIPFTQAEDDKKCEYCDYRLICKR